MTTAANLSENIDGVELFAPGTYYGREYTEADLAEIAENTNALIEAERHDPPAKLGHDDEQAFAKESGLPAVGWVRRVYVKGAKLLADFTDVPDMVVQAIKKRLYRKVSAEIYLEKAAEREFGVKGKVLRAVAFLGADVPKVKGLKPFMASEVQSGDTATVTVERHEEESVAGDKGDGDGKNGKLMVPANRHPYGALVKMDGEEGAHKVVGVHPDGTYDVTKLHGGDGKVHGAVPHDSLALMDEREARREEEARMAEEKAVKLAEQERDAALELAEKEKARRVELEEAAVASALAAFEEKHKTALIPALHGKFRALARCGTGAVALSEKEKPQPFHEALMAFLAELIEAKQVALGEAAPGKGEDKEAEVRLAEQPFRVHVDEARGAKPELMNGELAVKAERYAEEHKVTYSTALKKVARLEAVAGGERA